MIPKEADYLIRGYSKAPHRVLLETWHKGEASRDIEITAWKERMRRGEVAYIEVVDRNRPFDPPQVISSFVLQE